jgi:hypothetical protein
VNVGLRVAPGLDKRPQGVLQVGHHLVNDFVGILGAATAREDAMRVGDSGEGCHGSAR